MIGKTCRTFFRILLALFMLVQQPSLAQSLKPGVKRILFLGNSITWAGNYVNDIEAYLRVHFPVRQFEFINVGLPSETVSGLSEPGHADGSFPRPDLHERLSRVLEQIKPDLVFACYGMNDGIYMPFDEKRFQKFKDGINWLHNEVSKTGARIIHVTPPYYDEARGKSIGYSAVLDRYSDWLITRRGRAKWEVIDVHYPMKKYLFAHRKVGKTSGSDVFELAHDGIHPGELGHWIMAREILSYLGFKGAEHSGNLLESLGKLQSPEAYLKVVTDRQNMLRDAWLTATKYKRPGLPVGLPLDQAESKSKELMLQIDSLLKPIH